MGRTREFSVEIGDEEVALPTKYEVCPRCRGEGKIVNPAVDGNGISQEQFDEEPDFEVAYHRGDYDIRCPECLGERVVLVPDQDLMTRDQVMAWQRKLDEDRSVDMMYASERRMGA